MEIFPISTRFFLPPSAQATASSFCSNLFLYVFFRTPEPRAVPCRHSGGLPVTHQRDSVLSLPSFGTF